MMKVYSFCAGELGTNSIVLVKNGKCIVIDVPYGADSVEKFISDNQLQLVAVLLTHGHFDHVGGVQRLIDRFGCSDLPVFIHSADEKLANCASQNRWSVKSENCYPTKHVSKGHYSVDCFDFDVIETPGHTEGSVCYVFDECNLLVSGDTLFCGGIGRTDFPESVPSQMRSSLAKLKCLDKNYEVVCGHGPSTSLDAEKRTNPYLL